MRTRPTWDPGGTKIVSFSVSSCAFTGLGGVEKILRSVAGLEIVRRRRFLRISEEIHFEFRFRGAACVVWEPWADSSEYVVAQTADTEPVDLAPVEATFRARKWWSPLRLTSSSTSATD